jgi:hypothetical protein
MYHFDSSEGVEGLAGAFLDQTLPKVFWTHEAHLAVALWHLSQYTPVETLGLMRSRIISYNVAVGGTNDLQNGYHETLTVFWIAAVQAFVAQHDKTLPLLGSCEALFAHRLGERTLPLTYYSRERLFSVEARAKWTPPDLRTIEFFPFTF